MDANSGAPIQLTQNNENSSSHDNEPDETIQERVVGLTEMIPGEIRRSLGVCGRFLWSAYQVACDASWILFSMVAFAFGPVVYETELERDQIKNDKSGNDDVHIASSSCSQ